MRSHSSRNFSRDQLSLLIFSGLIFSKVLSAGLRRNGLKARRPDGWRSLTERARVGRNFGPASQGWTHPVTPNTTIVRARRIDRPSRKRPPLGDVGRELKASFSLR